MSAQPDGAMPTLIGDIATARAFPVIGDAMSPTLKPCRDVAMVKPCDTYLGEGIYAIESLGQIDFVRVDVADPGKRLHLLRDNDRYTARTSGIDQFEEIVLGKVFGVITFYCPKDFAAFINERCPTN